MIGGNDAIDAVQADLASTGPSVTAQRGYRDVGRRRNRRAGRAPARLRRTARGRRERSRSRRAACGPSRSARERRRGRGSRGGERDLGQPSIASSLPSSARIEAGGSWLPPTPVITRFDLHAALSGARQAMAANGANAVDACFDSERLSSLRGGRRVSSTPPARPSLLAAHRALQDFVFFDGIHPSGAAHAAIGDALRRVL